jgi:release factor family 10
MITIDRLRSLARIAQPVVSLYWTLPRLGNALSTPPPEEWTRLKAAVRELAATLPSDDRDRFEEYLPRIYDKLRDRSRPPESLVLLVGQGVSETIELAVPVNLEVHWGAPDLFQLLTIVGENRPYGIAVVDHSGAWLFRFQAGELRELQELSFSLNTSDWKQKDIGHFSAPAGVKVNKTRGSQHDGYQHRVDAHYDRFCGVVAERLRHFHNEEHFAGFFLLGSPRVTRRISAQLPIALLPRIVRIENERGHASLKQLRAHVIAPKVASWQQEVDSAVVSSLLRDAKDVVTGLAEILNLLQRGELHRVVLSPDLDAPVQQCTRCKWVNISADPYCPACHSARSATRLRRVLAQLLLNRGTEFTVLTGPAASKLLEMGGIAAIRESVELPAPLHEVSAA